MALKGTTKIELTNVKTGEREVIEKDNLVTNAVASALSNPFLWQLRTVYSGSYVSGNILPLCPNLFGGILLYEDAIPEDVNQLYAQSTNKLVGYSSNNVNDKTDIMRGSMNLNESGDLEDGSGYRFVFDFTTAQANGTISAVGLTSKFGGMAGFGSEEYVTTSCPIVYAENNYINNTWTNIGLDIAYRNVNTITYDEDTDQLTSIYVSGQNLITIERYHAGMASARLLNRFNLYFPSQSEEIHTIETKTFAGYAISSGYRYLTFCDAGNGYVWGFEHEGNAKGNSSGKAKVNWIKIKLDDLSFEEGTWEIDAQILVFGAIGVKEWTTYGIEPSQTNAVILAGYLYCINYAKTGVYKINLDNISDIVFIEHPDKAIKIHQNSSYTNVHAYYFVSNLAKVGNVVSFANGYLNGDKIVKNKTVSGSLYPYYTTNPTPSPQVSDYSEKYTNGYGLRGIDFGVFSLHIQGQINNANDTRIMSALVLNSPYLATINNLTTPVQKTADKTMKITYTLTEE